MSFQWTFLASFLYSEVFAVIILLLPFISPARWQKFFKSRIAIAFTAGAKYYFNFIICIFLLLFVDAIRELRKYSGFEVKDLSTPHAEVHSHMKQFRSQRNFYIAGFALFLWFVIRRLINLLGTCARQMADASAARKQAEGAQRHLESMMADDPTKIDEGEIVASPGNPPRYTDTKAELEKYKREATELRERVEELRRQCDVSAEECERLAEENRRAQVKLAILSGESSKDK